MGFVVSLYAGLSVLGCSDHAVLGGICSDACVNDVSPDAGRPDESSCAAGCGTTDASPPGEEPDARCDDLQQALARRPLDILLVVDDDATASPWWSLLREGLDSFLRSPDAAGIGVGLARVEDTCGPLENTDAAVPISKLPDNADAVMAAIPLIPLGNHAFTSAIESGLQTARAHARDHTDASVLLIVLSDISPSACDALYLDYAAEAASRLAVAQEAEPSFGTYLLGFGALGTQTAPAIEPATRLRLFGLDSTAEDVRAALDDAVNSVCGTLTTTDCLAPNGLCMP